MLSPDPSLQSGVLSLLPRDSDCEEAAELLGQGGVAVRAGLRCQIFRAPRELTDLGCAYAVRLASTDLAAALPVLHREALDPVQIFLNQRGVFREVGHDLS